MKRVGIVYLITENPEAAGVLDERTETRRKTYCEEISLSMSETYQARASGFSPIFRLRLPQDFEYRKETLCEYKGERYSIIRDYRDEKTGNATELTLERVRGNAAAPAEEPEPEPDPEEAQQGEPAVTGGSEGSGAPVGQSPEGDSDPNESTETSGANANSGATATIEGAEPTESEPAAGTPEEGGEP